MAQASRLRFLPVSFFSVVMGLTGFSVALEKARHVLGLPFNAGAPVLAGTVALFVALTALYGFKVLRHREEVVQELRHPVKLAFFPTFSISLILLGTAFLSVDRGVSFLLWAAGAALQLVLTLFVLSRWITQTTFEVHHSNPSWFIPVVGNILVPVAGVAHGELEVSWFFFSIGVVFWLLLFTVLFYRVVFHHPLPEKLAPTFFILVAPPAVGFLAYVQLAGGVDAFARVLFHFGLFLCLLLAVLYRQFVGIRFFLSWWAYSFPTAAFTLACMIYYSHTGAAFAGVLSWFMLLVLTGVIALLAVKTVQAVGRGEICVEE